MDVRIFTQDDVRHFLKMPRAIELMRDAFAALSCGRIDSPVRTVLTSNHGTVLYKPAFSEAQSLFCAKVVSVFPGNADRELPVTPGIIVLNDGETGMPVAAGGRTVVAIRYTANPAVAKSSRIESRVKKRR